MTDAELAILGLIVEKERHGYDIEQVIEQRNMRQWTELSFSSIYFVLKKLEKEGWVESYIDTNKPDNQKGPARRMYRITGEGYEAWYEALINVIAYPRPHHDPFQIGLANLPAVGSGGIRALQERREMLVKIREELAIKRAIAYQESSAALHVDAMFELSQALVNAELEWLDGFLKRYTIKD